MANTKLLMNGPQKDDLRVGCRSSGPLIVADNAVGSPSSIKVAFSDFFEYSMTIERLAEKCSA